MVLCATIAIREKPRSLCATMVFPKSRWLPAPKATALHRQPTKQPNKPTKQTAQDTHFLRVNVTLFHPVHCAFECCSIHKASRMDAFGRFEKPLEAVGSFWKLLGISSSLAQKFVKTPGASGSSWKPIMAFKSF